MKDYIGDGVYAEYDGHDIVLTTENGVEVTNRIVLEPEVWAALNDFVLVRGRTTKTRQITRPEDG